MRNLLLTLLLCLACQPDTHAEENPAEGLGTFGKARMQRTYVVLQANIQKALAEKNYDQAEDGLRRSLDINPYDALDHYNLSCVLARKEDSGKALDHLEKAVQYGFRNAGLIHKDDDFDKLREEPRFKELLASLDGKKLPGFSFGELISKSGKVEDGVAEVSESNSYWDFRNGLLHVFFDFSEGPGEKQIIKGHGKVGELLSDWFEKGTAAGNHGDLYDNHDNGHSKLAAQNFPQLGQIKYSEEARSVGFSNGLQLRQTYNATVIGNSSTALTGGPFWRSQARMAYTSPGGAALLYLQYVRNHLYIYPEHRDHDPEKGDVFPANTPYVIVSQGSSGSDRVFLDAMACGLASLRPDVKDTLKKAGALMPTMQMVFRFSNKHVQSEENYLKGTAHPTVFQGDQIDLEYLVRMAQKLEKDQLPPLVRLRVVEEDASLFGGDRLFDTPCAIARVFRSEKYYRRMVVSAEQSVDLNGKELGFHWRVLRGDDESIKINKLNEKGSVVELLIPHHPRQPIADGAEMESNRVDIGAFVSNGSYHSAPAFVTTYFLDNETRIYGPEKRLEALDYTDKATMSNYVDPMIEGVKNWRDEFNYSDGGKLLGWTRNVGGEKVEFSADGRLVERDTAGEIIGMKNVRYTTQSDGKSRPVVKFEAIP